jgi:hypothetical protein
MPRHILNPPARCHPPDELVEELARELRAPRDHGQPMVIEEPLLTGLIQIQVIWDKLQGLGDEDRIELILAAYERAEGKSYRDKIVSAVGYTLSEADDFGLLPYKIEPADPKDKRARHEEYWQAMVDEGAFENDEEQLELCFRTLDEANEAKIRLESRLPSSKWTILKEVSH